MDIREESHDEFSRRIMQELTRAREAQMRRYEHIINKLLASGEGFGIADEVVTGSRRNPNRVKRCQHKSKGIQS